VITVAKSVIAAVVVGVVAVAGVAKGVRKLLSIATQHRW
jgi:hypothetical protein